MPYLGNIPATQFSSLAYQDLTGGTGTAFTLDNAVGSAQDIEVFVNNVRQEPGVAYTVSGTSLTMTGSIVATDDFYIVFQGKAVASVTHPSNSALNATSGTFTSDLTVDTDTLVVDATNNRVGVGTSSPSEKVEILHSSDAALKWSKSGSSYSGYLYQDANGSGVFNAAGVAGEGFYLDRNSQYMYMTTAGTERARIDSSGNVLVGQTTKRGKVTLSYNTNTVSDPTVYVANDGGSAALITFGDGGGSNTYGSITKGSGNTVSYTTSSDYRLKENLADITDGITRLKQLEPKRFNFIADEDDTTVDGFLAHEVQAVVPEAITGEKDAVDADGNPEYQGIDQAKLVPLLTAALQEAVSKIEALETANASMETRLTALEGA